jgi:beta-glucanase (GH16 family)
MNKTIVTWLVCFYALVTSVASLRAANVLADPGFESDASGQHQNILGWTWYGQPWGNTFNESGSDARSGGNFFKVFQGFTGNVNYNGVYQDYISGPGATYTADGWAKMLSTDALAGQNIAWMEVTFRDANATILALYRSSIISNSFPKNLWVNLPVTNQYNPVSFNLTNTTKSLVAPAGTYFVRYQVVLQGDAAGSSGSVYFDDLNLNLTSAAPYGDWNIVWTDEFNGNSIDASTWTFDLGNGGSNPGWGNNELEFYTGRTNNVSVADGLLHIIARKESTNGFNYTSARIKTQGLRAWKYGRFEWRARCPGGTGFWPALWFLGTNITSVGWPGCGEIDVMEANGASHTNVQGSLHSGGTNGDPTAIYTFLNGDSVTNFHTFVLDWSTNAFLFYVDGHLYQSQNSWTSSAGTYPTPFDKPAFMIINLAVGGNYVGNPSVATINANGGFPSELQVDYVRVLNQTAPLKIFLTRTNSALFVSWPSNVVGHVQAQINSLTTNWVQVGLNTNPLPVSATNTAAFFRLISP